MEGLKKKLQASTPPRGMPSAAIIWVLEILKAGRKKSLAMNVKFMVSTAEGMSKLGQLLEVLE